MLIEIKIKKLVYVLCLEIKEEHIQENKDVKLVDVVDAQKRIFFLEDKTLNTIQKIKKDKVREKSKAKILRQEMDAVKIV